VEAIAQTRTKDITIGQVAAAAHVSDRTVYNHFGSVDLLIDAVSDHLSMAVLPDPVFDDAESLADGVRDAWQLSAEQERVLRATFAFAARTQEARYTLVREALHPVVDHLPPREAKVGVAAILAARGGDVYLMLRDKLGATPDEAADAMAWLVRLGVDDLRARNDVAKQRARRK